MPDGTPIKRVDWQLDGYKFSYNGTAIHEPVTPAIPGLNQANIVAMGSLFKIQSESSQPYTRTTFSVANVTSLPARIEILVAYSAFQIYSVNCGLTDIADGYNVRGWVEFY